MADEDILNRFIGNTPDAELKAEPGRYALYVSHSCPFAHRAIIARQLMGLENTVQMIELAPTLPASGIGWHFDETYTDTLNNWTRLKQAYDATFQCDYQGNQSEPLLWDSTSRSIVSNESIDIMRMLIDAFTDYAAGNRPDLRPVDMVGEIEALTDYIDDNLSSLVYNAHFNEDRQEREKQMDTIFNVMDELEDRLAGQAYLWDEQITESDLILFPTLTRFESVYAPLFHVNRKALSAYPVLSAYMRNMAKTHDLKDTVRFAVNVESYYRSPMLNPDDIEPPTKITPILD